MRPAIAPGALKRTSLDRREVEGWRERAGRLYAEFQGPARKLIANAFRGAFGDPESEDIYSAAWVGTLRALEHRQARMSDEEIRKYLLTAVANQAAKELRRRKRKPTAPLELVGGVADHAGTPDERAVERDTSRVTKDLLMSLPPRRRAVMLLRYGWGLEPRQVCDMVAGLSPRAYRKEVTRGVDELTERVHRFDAGTWCADREPLLKAFAAGLAKEDEQRQARAHLSHCRECCDFVAKLNGHLHDLGGALLVPSTIDGVGGELVLGKAVAGLADKAAEVASRIAGRGNAEATQEIAASALASGGTRGAGAAGAGVLAKLAGAGAAGKAAVACVTGGVAATACVAAGIGPIGSEQPTPARDAGSAVRAEPEVPEHVPEPPAPGTLPSQIGNDDAPAAPPDPPAPAEEPSEPQPAPEPEAPAEEAVAPSTPPVEQEFGAPAAAEPTAPAPSATSAGSGGGDDAAVRQEFAP